nr:hypothetical protein [Pseudomonas juntendi]
MHFLFHCSPNPNSLNSSAEKLKSVESIQELHRLLRQMDLSPTLRQANQVIANIESSMLRTLQELESSHTVTAEALAKVYSEAIAQDLSAVCLSLTQIAENAKAVGSKLFTLLQRAETELPDLATLDKSLANIQDKLEVGVKLLVGLGLVSLSSMTAVLYLLLR